mgnify:CR=1 FL=1
MKTRDQETLAGRMAEVNAAFRELGLAIAEAWRPLIEALNRWAGR